MLLPSLNPTFSSAAQSLRRNPSIQIPSPIFRTYKNSSFPVAYPKFIFPRRTHVVLFSSPAHDHSTTSPESELKVPELELLGKPSLVQVPEDSIDSRKPPEADEALAPFLKFFRSHDDSDDEAESMEGIGELDAAAADKVKELPPFEGLVGVEYYDPKPGDRVVGVVVSGNENKMDVSIGADMLGTMLTKEIMPFYEEELPHLLCDMEKGVEEFMVPGKIGVVKDEEALSGEMEPGRPVVEAGTVIFAEVLGRTLSGRPLLSSRRLFRKIAWHRVRQIKQVNEPIEVKIFEWNTGGLLTRIEGLRAFLPKAELMNRATTFMDLKENVGRRTHVCISRIDEAVNDLIISEKEAWDMLNLKEGTLLEGTVRKILPYGAQVRIGETNRSGFLHISNITHKRVISLSDVLNVDEKVKVLVVKSMFPGKISFSIADLESEPGLFLSNKEKVFSEAEEMAERYRQRLPIVSHKPEPLPDDMLPFDDETKLYSNWKWFIFERDDKNVIHRPDTVSQLQP